MKIIGGNRFALSGANDEIIAVTFKATGTAFLVTYEVDNAVVIDGPNKGSMVEGVPLQFKLNNQNGSRNDLNLGFTFATPDDVSGAAAQDPVKYDVELTSNQPNSDKPSETVDGSFGIPGDTRQWRFFLS